MVGGTWQHPTRAQALARSDHSARKFQNSASRPLPSGLLTSHLRGHHVNPNGLCVVYAGQRGQPSPQSFIHPFQSSQRGHNSEQKQRKTPALLELPLQWRPEP